jgi:PKD repeat protein
MGASNLKGFVRCVARPAARLFVIAVLGFLGGAPGLSAACPPGGLALVPATLSGGAVGTEYDQVISTTNGSGATTYLVSSGNLPPGLGLSSSGTLSGVPSSPGSFSFAVTATDHKGCTGTLAYSVPIACPPISISPNTLPNGTVATPYSQTLTASGGTAPYEFSLSGGNLPPGLGLSPTGIVSGTPTSPGDFAFSIVATDASACTGSHTYAVTISSSCPAIVLSPDTLPSATTGTAYSQTITASGGVGPYSFTVASGSPPPGLTLASSGALTGTPTALGTFNFVVQATDVNTCTGTRSYSITVTCPTISITPASLPAASTGTAYSQVLTGSGGVAPYTFTISSGSLPGGLTLSSSGTLSGTPTALGTFNFAVLVTDASGCSNSQNYSITVSCGTVALSPVTLPGGTIGVAYGQTITASRGTAPFTFAVSSGTLPAGLALSPAGSLTGTPTAAGTFNFAVRATDANGCTGTQNYSIVVACPTITLSPATLPSGTVGIAYSQTITASGGVGPYSFTVTNGALPTGLTLSPGGVLSGTPTTTGNFTFIVTGTDANGCSASRGYSVSIATEPCPTITLSPSSFPAGTVGTPYSQTITPSGGTAPYSLSVPSGTLPGGLTLSASGVLAGTPTLGGVFTFFVTATDRNGCSGTAQYTLTIAAANAPVLTALNPGSASAGGGGFTLGVAGSGFVSGSTVRWNGSPRPTTFLSPTSLSALISASDVSAAGSIPVTVVNPGGASSNALLFTISSVCQPPAAPQGPTIVPNDNPAGPVTGIDFLRLSWSAPSSGAAPSRYEWSLNGDPFVSAGTATSVVAPPRGNNDPIQLHVRAVGCSPGPAADSPVYAPQAPSASFSTPGPSPVGAPVTFTDTSDPQATSWLWLFGDGQIATTQSTTHAFSAAGTYSVVLIASNGAGSSMALHTQAVQVAAQSAERSASSRGFDASEPGRQRIRELRLIGPRRTWLQVAVPGSQDETIVYLRFYDAAGRLVLERRLSVAGGQQAVYDLGAFRLRGIYSVEAVSARQVDLAVVETGPPEPAKRREP